MERGTNHKSTETEVISPMGIDANHIPHTQEAIDPLQSHRQLN